MSKHGIMKRYMLIIERVNSLPSPSFADIDRHLRDNGLEYSKRTLDRDIENIRYDMGVEIKYDRSSNSYIVDEEHSINLDTFNRFLEIAGMADLLSEGVSKKANVFSYISFESENIQSKGVELLKPILSCIIHQHEICFLHENFQKKTLKEIRMRPYLLKEYQARWYVVGRVGSNDTVRTYGLDRMSKLEDTGQFFEPKRNFQPKQLFENVIGLVYSTNKLTEVILSFTPDQGKYIETLPLHHSQYIFKKNKNECLVRLNIIPNFELKQRILMYGANVRVLEPQWLADEIAAEHKKAASLY